jgi:hypothetical protein
MIRINSSNLCLYNRKSKKEFILQAYAPCKYLNLFLKLYNMVIKSPL